MAFIIIIIQFYVWDKYRRDQFRWKRELLVGVDHVNMGPGYSVSLVPLHSRNVCAYHTVTLTNK